MKKNFRQLVQNTLKNHSSEAVLLESMPEEAWVEYEKIMQLYSEKKSIEGGWYSYICGTLRSFGVYPRLAHLLTDLRDKISSNTN